MKNNKVLFLLEGTLRIQKADGYWFTSGGDKGSFGFYPHLKKNDCPIFPDTQIHGDLKMAARWLCRLDGNHYNMDLIPEIFGMADYSESSKLKLSDLELADKENWGKNLFDVKTRTEIDDEMRINKNHMLVDLEWSYMENQSLTASVFLGYFDDPSKMESARELIDHSLDLLSGFGASRSRGAGRGRMKILWKDAPKEIAYRNKTAGENSGSFAYVLEPLCNFRNKQINPGASQLLCADPKISGQQLRSWFARIYHQLFDTWPTPEQMGQIDFSTAYPAFEQNGRYTPAYPPPNTTLIFEDDHIEDMYGRQKETDEEEQDNFVRTKAKPLPDNVFLTNSDMPEAVNLKINRRIRNATINEGQLKNGIQSALTEFPENFTTIQNGLFVQELILKKQPFMSSINIHPPGGDADFCKKARYILESVYPDIGGAFFKPALLPNQPEALTNGDYSMHHLVYEPLAFNPDQMSSPESQVSIGVKKSYNSMQKRPRRNRIVFLPGSLIDSASENKTIIWKGLGRKNIPAYVQRSAKAGDHTEQDPAPSDSQPAKLNSGKISLSQAGNLREMLLMKPELARIRIEEILQKYRQWDKNAIEEHLIPAEILETLSGYLEKGLIEDFKNTIYSVCEDVSLKNWKKKKTRISGELKKAKAKFFSNVRSDGKGRCI